jgi:hypothetical protein
MQDGGGALRSRSLYASIGDSNSGENRLEQAHSNQSSIAVPRRPKTALPRSRTDSPNVTRVKHLSLDDSLKLSAGTHSTSAPNTVQSKRENFSQQKHTGHVMHMNSARANLGMTRDGGGQVGLGGSLDTAASSSTVQQQHSASHHHEGSHHSPTSMFASLSPRSRFLHLQKERDKERERDGSAQLRRDQIFLNTILGIIFFFFFLVLISLRC